MLMTIAVTLYRLFTFQKTVPRTKSSSSSLPRRYNRGTVILIPYTNIKRPTASLATTKGCQPQPSVFPTGERTEGELLEQKPSKKTFDPFTLDPHATTLEAKFARAPHR